MGGFGGGLGLGMSPSRSAQAGISDSLASLLFPSGEPGVLLDLSEPSSVFQDRSGSPSTPALANDPVGTVLDLSGNANHLIAPNDAARAPLGQAGDQAWLAFDGVDHGYEFQAGFPLNQSLDLFLGLNTSDTSFMLISHGGYQGTGSTVPDIARIQNGVTGQITAGAGDTSVFVDGVSVTNNRDIVHDAITGSAHVLRISGLDLSSSVTPTVAAHAATGLRFDGNIHVLAIAPTQASGVTAQIEALIAAKIGL